MDRNRHHGRTRQYRRRSDHLKGDYISSVSLPTVEVLTNESATCVRFMLKKSIQKTTESATRSDAKLCYDQGCEVLFCVVRNKLTLQIMNVQVFVATRYIRENAN